MRSVYISGLTYICNMYQWSTTAGPALAVGGPSMLMAPSHEDARADRDARVRTALTLLVGAHPRARERERIIL